MCSSSRAPGSSSREPAGTTTRPRAAFRCGTLAPHLNAARGRVVVPAGSLDDDPGAREELHIFVSSKAPWYEIADDLPQHEAYPPGAYPPPSRRPRDAGARG